MEVISGSSQDHLTSKLGEADGEQKLVLMANIVQLIEVLKKVIIPVGSQPKDPIGTKSVDLADFLTTANSGLDCFPRVLLNSDHILEEKSFDEMTADIFKLE